MLFPLRNIFLVVTPEPALLPVTSPSPDSLRIRIQRIPSPLTDPCRLPEDKQANAMECGTSHARMTTQKNDGSPLRYGCDRNESITSIS